MRTSTFQQDLSSQSRRNLSYCHMQQHRCVHFSSKCDFMQIDSFVVMIWCATIHPFHEFVVMIWYAIIHSYDKFVMMTWCLTFQLDTRFMIVIRYSRISSSLSIHSNVAMFHNFFGSKIYDDDLSIHTLINLINS